MTQSTIGSAFFPLEARSAAGAPENVHDRILLTDYTLEAEIGAFQEERGTRQGLRFNIVVEVLSALDDPDDDVDKILSYDTLIEAIDFELTGGRINLLETLAENIATRMLSFAFAHRIFIRIEKLDRGPYTLGVEIMRAQSPKLVKQAKLASNTVFLDAQTLKRDDLSSLIDELASENKGLILCVDLPAAPSSAPKLSNKAAQRRIDLLHIEQQAWRLAAINQRCLVVHSKTELDWAIKRKKIMIWAPSKMVLDMPKLRQSPLDPLACSIWLGELIGSERLIAFAENRPIAHALKIIWRK